MTIYRLTNVDDVGDDIYIYIYIHTYIYIYIYIHIYIYISSQRVPEHSRHLAFLRSRFVIGV